MKSVLDRYWRSQLVRKGKVMGYVTTIWIRTELENLDEDWAPPPRQKCIWKGELPHVLRAEDKIVVKECIERVETACFDLTDNTVDVKIAGIDAGNEYSEVPYR